MSIRNVCPGPPGLAAGDVRCTYKVTSTIGHVYKFEFPDDFRRWKGVDPESLFSVPPERLEANLDAAAPQRLAAKCCILAPK